MNARRSVAPFLWLMAAYLLTGCAGANVLKWPGSQPSAGPKNRVVEILPMWQPAEATLNGRPTRGFAGQIYFFGSKSDAPIDVDEDVQSIEVYVFDDVGTPEEQVQPLHRFEYHPSAWKKMKYEGKLGTGYAIFVPYTREGRLEAKCSLRMHYNSKGGSTVYTDMLTVALSGKPKKPAEGTYDEYLQEKRSSASAAGAANPAQPAGDKTIAQTPAADAPRTERPSIDAVPLTQAERDRIIRETRAKLAEMGNGRVTSAEYAPVREGTTVPRSRRFAMDDAGTDGYSDDVDRPARERSGKSLSRRRISSDLTDSADGEESDAILPQKRHIRSPNRHPVEYDADDEKSADLPQHPEDRRGEELN